jgi:hypothetical protein
VGADLQDASPECVSIAEESGFCEAKV